MPADDTGASRRIMVNAGWLGVQPLVLNVFGILSTAFIARQLGTAAYGRFNYGVAIVMTIGARSPTSASERSQSGGWRRSPSAPSTTSAFC